LSIRQGDESGLKILYQQYSNALYGIVMGVLRREEDSQEVLQIVFLKIWNNIESYNESKATLFTWMSQIARNTAIDRKRLKSFEMGSKTQSFDTEHNHSLADDLKKDVDIKFLIKDLPEKYKVLISKMFLEGYTQQEIADELEMPLGTVKTRLRDAIKILRESLKNEKHLLYTLFIM
jgi:RNA polymerase sigma factor (sigma-70 family)